MATADRTGVERVVANLVAGLPAGECGALVLSDGPLVRELRSINVPTCVFPVSSRFALSRIFSLARLLRNSGAGILHAHGARACFFSGIAAAWAGIPVRIATIHELAGVPNLNTTMEHLCYKLFFSHFVAVSDAVRRDAISRRKLSPDRLTTIHNSVRSSAASEKITPQQRGSFRFIIGAIGRLSPPKGYSSLIEAFPLILKEAPEAELHIAGDGPLRTQLEAQVAELRLGDRVKFLGEIARSERFYASIDLLVVPSLSESFGLVILEAMQQGVAVVASDAGGIPEIVTSGRNGLLFRAGSSAELAGAVLRLIHDPSERNQLAEAGRASVHRFSAAQFVEAHRRLYSSLSESPRTAPVIA